MIKYKNAGGGGPTYASLCVESLGNIIEFRVGSNLGSDVQLNRDQVSHLINTLKDWLGAVAEEPPDLIEGKSL